MTTAWSHLPNAAHIDAILASLKTHPEQWNAARGVARDTEWNAARSAILCLIAYDDCAYMIESEIGELKILVAFGDEKAVLLLPACIAFHSIKELGLV